MITNQRNRPSKGVGIREILKRVMYIILGLLVAILPFLCIYAPWIIYALEFSLFKSEMNHDAPYVRPSWMTSPRE